MDPPSFRAASRLARIAPWACLTTRCPLIFKRDRNFEGTPASGNADWEFFVRDQNDGSRTNALANKELFDPYKQYVVRQAAGDDQHAVTQM